MNTKLLSAFLAMAMLSGIASAQIAVSANANINANVQVGSSSAAGTVKGQANASTTHGNATSTAKKDESSTTTTGTTTVKSNASATGQEHMSVVARFVQSLLSIANREGGIGAQVRMIAQSQNDTASTSVSAITNIETRSKLLTFLFGTDYKSIGQLRSDMTTTQANLDSLQKLADKTTSTTDKAELEAQIKSLQDAQVKLDAFIKTHEAAFSLFGWLRSGQ